MSPSGTIHDKRAEPLVPRWVSIATVVGALLVPTANGCALAMTGAFSWHGVLAFYISIGIWGVWLDGHAWYIRRRMAEKAAGIDSTVEIHGPVPGPYPGGPPRREGPAGGFLIGERRRAANVRGNDRRGT